MTATVVVLIVVLLPVTTGVLDLVDVVVAGIDVKVAEAVPVNLLDVVEVVKTTGKVTGGDGGVKVSVVLLELCEVTVVRDEEVVLLVMVVFW